MLCKLSDFRCKEVINVCDGCRLGFVCDLEINTVSGQIITIIVPGRGKLFGIFFRSDDFYIPWECISKIGEDLILVEISEERARKPRTRKKWKL